MGLFLAPDLSHKKPSPFLPPQTPVNRSSSALTLSSPPSSPSSWGSLGCRHMNPKSIGTKKEISFSSPYCFQHCLTPALSSCLSVTPAPDNLHHVPPVNLEFRDIFDKEKPDCLPPHRSYDCPIELLPGSEVPFGRIFPLSETELVAHKSYIDENLDKSFICPSSIPAGASIFFVKKKDGFQRPRFDYRELNKITIKK